MNTLRLRFGLVCRVGELFPRLSEAKMIVIFWRGGGWRFEAQVKAGIGAGGAEDLRWCCPAINNEQDGLSHAARRQP
jgi:hypothetical protein